MTVRAILDALKSVNANGATLDELMVLSAQAAQLKAQYQAHEVETPVWLIDADSSLSDEITHRNRDILAARLKELDAAESGLQSAAERRLRIAEERNKILARMGKAPVSA